MNDKIVYPAVFEYGEGTIGVSFPDIDGVVTAAETIGDALEQAREALLFHLEGMLEDGDVLPDASHPDAVELGPQQYLTFVDVPYPVKVERRNITATTAQWARIDAAAKATGLDRSGFMVKYALAAYNGNSGDAVAAGGAWTWAARQPWQKYTQGSFKVGTGVVPDAEHSDLDMLIYVPHFAEAGDDMPGEWATPNLPRLMPCYVPAGFPMAGGSGRETSFGADPHPPKGAPRSGGRRVVIKDAPGKKL